jgi:glutamine---fructose-6-phosphate transaminase (isomerizing)
MEKRIPVIASPFERDIDDQAEALRAFLRSRPSGRLSEVARGTYDRIVLTGMGSSHSAALPTWRDLTQNGYSAWWVDSGQLLDTPRLVTPETLLIVTSQSGASGEVSALFDPASGVNAKAVVGVTNDPGSPLGQRADAIIELCSGGEATVSTKSYLNTLAAHRRLLAVMTGKPVDDGDESAADFLDRFSPAPQTEALAESAARSGQTRIAFVGDGDHAASALYAGLITKEAAKVPAEGYIGGQFRHGPLELSGEGLTAILFGVFRDGKPSLRRLAADLVATGTTVALVGDVMVPGAPTIPVPRDGGTLTALMADALVAQRFAVGVAKARGIEPGAFRYGSKVTTAL